jgi:hypothetical protein
MQGFTAQPAVMPMEECIGACLNRFGDAVRPAGRGRWRISRSGHEAAPTTVVVDQGWLVVEQTFCDCRLARVDDIRQWSAQLLDAGRNLPSGARPVLPVEDDQVRMRAERSLPRGPSDGEDDYLWRWIESACTDVAVGPAAALPTAAAEDALDSRGRDHVARSDIPALCELAGWHASSRGAGDETLVALPTRDGDVCHAIVSVEDAAVRLRTALEISAAGEKTPASLAAVAVALLRVAGSVRLIRSTLTEVEGSMGATLDVRVQPPLAPRTLEDALSSLAVARQQVAAELDALAGSDSLAIAYLALQGAR